ncbi:putative pentatricopeptide repeat-containing protein [Senna tora]|uniref:Putative pentatricopeptide repeat-containing protein n=1 Tax=Senna tora TaxID=362788 RepID=A0A834TVV7_9FABA|nr:putative pentatricopeptide repeat-containing protein [Senna tora]
MPKLVEHRDALTTSRMDQLEASVEAMKKKVDALTHSINNCLSPFTTSDTIVDSLSVASISQICLAPRTSQFATDVEDQQVHSMVSDDELEIADKLDPCENLSFDFGTNNDHVENHQLLPFLSSMEEDVENEEAISEVIDDEVWLGRSYPSRCPMSVSIFKAVCSKCALEIEDQFDDSVEFYENGLLGWLGYKFKIGKVVLTLCDLGIGNLGVGLKLHGRIIKYRLGIDAVIETLLLGMYDKLCCLGDAQKVLDKMGERNVVSLTDINPSYVENGKAREGLAMFNYMDIEGIKLAFVSMVEACAQFDCFKLTKWVHGYVLKRGLGGDGSLNNFVTFQYSHFDRLCDREGTLEKFIDSPTVSWTFIMILQHAFLGYGLEKLLVWNYDGSFILIYDPGGVFWLLQEKVAPMGLLLVFSKLPKLLLSCINCAEKSCNKGINKFAIMVFDPRIHNFSCIMIDHDAHLNDHAMKNSRILSVGGKRMRPSLVLWIAKGNVQYIEMMHIAGLIYASVWEEKKLRSLKEVVPQPYEMLVATLAGKFLFAPSSYCIVILQNLEGGGLNFSSYINLEDKVALKGGCNVMSTSRPKRISRSSWPTREHYIKMQYEGEKGWIIVESFLSVMFSLPSDTSLSSPLLLLLCYYAMVAPFTFYAKDICGVSIYASPTVCTSSGEALLDGVMLLVKQ